MEKNERLREIRLRLNKTQSQMARIFGITDSGYSLIESGRRGLKNIFVERLARDFNVNRDYLENGEGDMFETGHARRMAMFDSLTKEHQALVINFIKAIWMTETAEKQKEAETDPDDEA